MEPHGAQPRGAREGGRGRTRDRARRQRAASGPARADRCGELRRRREAPAASPRGAGGAAQSAARWWCSTPATAGSTPAPRPAGSTRKTLMLAFARDLQEALIRGGLFDVVLTRGARRVRAARHPHFARAGGRGERVSCRFTPTSCPKARGDASGHHRLYPGRHGERTKRAFGWPSATTRPIFLAGVTVAGPGDEIALVLMESRAHRHRATEVRPSPIRWRARSETRRCRSSAVPLSLGGVLGPEGRGFSLGAHRTRVSLLRGRPRPADRPRVARGRDPRHRDRTRAMVARGQRPGRAFAPVRRGTSPVPRRFPLRGPGIL